MKALSIRQPWASAIVHLGKNVENRTWSTTYRGPILIHAAKTISRDDMLAFDEVAAVAGVKFDGTGTLPLGCIIGQADIVDCISKDRVFRRDAAYGSPWFFGPYGFVLENVKPLQPRVCKGKLGFFDVAYDALPATHATEDSLL